MVSTDSLEWYLVRVAHPEGEREVRVRASDGQAAAAYAMRSTAWATEVLDVLWLDN